MAFYRLNITPDNFQLSKMELRPRQVIKVPSWLPEALFYVYLFIGGFAQLVLYIPNMAPWFLSLATMVATLKSPLRLKWVILPFLAVLTMVIIDTIGYEIGIETIKPCLFGTMIYAICLVLHEDPRFFDRAKFVLLIYLFCYFPFLTESYAGDPRSGLEEELQLGISNPNDLAFWCVFGVLASVVGFIKTQTFIRFLYLVTAFISGLVLLKTVSRSGLMMLAITMPIYVIFSCRKRQQLAPILVIFAFLAVGIWALQEPIMKNIEQYQSRMKYEEKAGYTFSGRTLFAQKGLENFLESPWMGTGSDVLYHAEANRLNSAHNVFIFIANHYGIWPTLFFFILWMIILWKSLWLVIRRKQQHLGDLPYELFAFTISLFLMSNMSNYMMFAPFSLLYMTKVLTMQPNKVTKRNGTL